MDLDPAAILAGIAKHGVGPILAVSVFLLSLSVYRGRGALTGWLEARTAAMKARDVGVLDKLNGHLDEKIDARVEQGNAPLRQAIQEINARLLQHYDEDRDAHERLAALEADVKTGGRRISSLEQKVDRLGEAQAANTGEIKADLRNLDKKIDTSTTDTKVLLSQILARMNKRRGDKDAA